MQFQDDVTTVEDLKKKVGKFCEDRDWGQFHDMKELAIGLSTESAELLDLMRFKSSAQVSDMLNVPVQREKIADELADIAWMLLRFCQLHKFDLSGSISAKMSKNEAKYPIETSRGSNRKYNE
jgi:NTP pyrophosphatase (non-canonical NTP hydrolase)